MTYHPIVRRRILVVDDNQDAAELLQQLLELFEFDVRIALNGAEALDIAPTFHPEATCSDLDMPVLSGFQLASALRKSEYSVNTCLIAMTGLNTEENYSLAIKSGFDVCLVKPFNIDVLVAELRMYFAKIP